MRSNWNKSEPDKATSFDAEVFFFSSDMFKLFNLLFFIIIYYLMCLLDILFLYIIYEKKPDNYLWDKKT